MRKMKDSGIEWIGEIPVEWDVVALKRFVKTNNGKEIDNEVEVDDKNAIEVYGSGGVFKYTDKYLYSGEAVLFGRKGTIGKPLYVNTSFWAVDTMYYLTHSKSLVAKYDYYLLTAFDWSPFITQTALPSIVASEIVSTSFPVPPLPEQRSIATYLDRKCSEIDSIVRDTEKTIEEYKKLKQSLITEVVTGKKRVAEDGLSLSDEPRKMKHSGVEWVKQIPEEWDSVTPKSLFTQRKDKAIKGEKQLTSSQQYGIVYQDEYMELTGAKIVTVIKDFDILKHVESGDFVISMRSFQGGLEYSTKTGSISSAYVMLIPNLNCVFPRYFRWLFKSQCYIKALQSTSNMVRDGQAMRYSNFSQIYLFNVPLKEQEKIADYLDLKCSQIGKLIAEKQTLLQEMETYKKSLIYECVTGKREIK